MIYNSKFSCCSNCIYEISWALKYLQRIYLVFFPPVFFFFFFEKNSHLFQFWKCNGPSTIHILFTIIINGSAKYFNIRFHIWFWIFIHRISSTKIGGKIKWIIFSVNCFAFITSITLLFLKSSAKLTFSPPDLRPLKNFLPEGLFGHQFHDLFRICLKNVKNMVYYSYLHIWKIHTWHLGYIDSTVVF